MRDTPSVEPETHRLDREAMVAEHRAVAERVRRETDEILAAAVAKRREYHRWQFERIRSIDIAERERRRMLRGDEAPSALGVTEERLRAALQGSKVMHRADPVVEPVKLRRVAGG